MLICIAFAIALLVCPDTLIAGQERTSAVDGYIPAAAKNVPKYDTPGRATGSVFASKIIYPIAAIREEPARKTALFPNFSDAIATPTVVRNANAYGGIVSSWAFAAV